MFYFLSTTTSLLLFHKIDLFIFIQLFQHCLCAIYYHRLSSSKTIDIDWNHICFWKELVIISDALNKISDLNVKVIIWTSFFSEQSYFLYLCWLARFLKLLTWHVFFIINHSSFTLLHSFSSSRGSKGRIKYVWVKITTILVKHWLFNACF